MHVGFTIRDDDQVSSIKPCAKLYRQTIRGPHRFTGFTLKTTASLIVFCAWLWWATFAGFTLLHVIALPVVIGILLLVL